MAVTKHAPSLPVDKDGIIQTQGSRFEHYMDMVPWLALQLDGLSDDGDGQCLEAALRYCHMHPRIPNDRVPLMQRAKASPADRLLYKVLVHGLTDVWRVTPQDIKDGRSAIALYRHFVSLNPRNPQGEYKVS